MDKSDSGSSPSYVSPSVASPSSSSSSSSPDASPSSSSSAIASSSATATKDLRLLSYNLYCLPYLVTFFAPAACPLPNERCKAFLPLINDYDIMGIQELWNPRFKVVEKAATDLGFYVVGSQEVSYADFFSLKVFSGGLMIISRYPIVLTKEIRFPRGLDVDAHVTKGILYAKIKVESTFVHVFNTHMQASYGNAEYQLTSPYSEVRKKQLDQMAKFMIEMTKEDEYPIVILGDFNVNARAISQDNTTFVENMESAEYLDMIRTLSGDLFTVVDVLKHFHDGNHPITYEGKGVHVGDKEGIGSQRLDFILEVTRKSPESPLNATDASSSTDSQTVALRPPSAFISAEVMPFRVENQTYTQISDHFGAHAIMRLHNLTGDESSASDSRPKHQKRRACPPSDS
eukprot:TRINITY_DN4657_c0_g1_i1.p1 TRINITY_DN4657_c0_g1~~TRINITY_DN4657_c0_g1_i1.p1  ORF type:complete len:401 (+),score=118.37 TRINITY_DN4657_c0_g1_i1:90-1292(+)